VQLACVVVGVRQDKQRKRANVRFTPRQEPTMTRAQYEVKALILLAHATRN
jgi:hypothetical protein